MTRVTNAITLVGNPHSNVCGDALAIISACTVWPQAFEEMAEVQLTYIVRLMKNNAGPFQPVKSDMPWSVYTIFMRERVATCQIVAVYIPCVLSVGQER